MVVWWKMMENQSSRKVDRREEWVKESTWMRGESGEMSGRGENEGKREIDEVKEVGDGQYITGEILNG
jgi:hypothetical protein